jgi:hypothetical protein
LIIVSELIEIVDEYVLGGLTRRQSFHSYPHWLQLCQKGALSTGSLLARIVEPSAAMKTVMSFMSALGCCLDNENELLVIYVGSEDRQRWGDGLKSIGFVGGLVGVQE